MLTERQLLILQIIIDDFIRSAHPVGSRTLAKKKGINFSSATIRNDMADLEELGLIEKTHTSSGRVPSEKGYRFYVDHLLSPEKLEQHELKMIDELFEESIFELEKIVQNSAKVLSELTKYTAIVLGPTVEDHKLSKFQIIPLNDDSAVAIIVTNTGHIEHKLFTIPSSIHPTDIEKTVNILNERLRGVPLSELNSKLMGEIIQLFKEHLHSYEAMFQSLFTVLNISSNDKLYYGGKINILKQPEFQDIEKIKDIIKLMEEEDNFYHLLRTTPFGTHVKIGTEIKVPEMEDLSLITATYNIGEEQFGKIAILGPKRMNYGKVISLLNLLSKNLTFTLSNLYDE
ncbi:heat-inducible transcriptional repressor HrcA [Caldibacillus thermolactis]|jgi:heat-inducible transcriptional repressor|uniref:Heat-inducible transcription repressor HrcA n=1 Tax=Pallidibacillus thermolactis TaxID=251051 RepID=A0ABT2WBA8_9BACI|nr:heat-inducible transcriptional repressor HrcA [Pallidibacillus thermolactis]MCU9592958.1 heat-inducible transcriptional repressor HrcA [Pallidibacillus thermolactis]MCU9600573.1 heat-inducible transcriptional repressor HrcA [Pallidibacillus thermolactis subsp. kokeshiiformis]MED1674372.1 heat-inducible transcriptional repressor HrcA [Pallidibacillus thermolactis subsp. kokeshiiformis]